MTVGVAVGVGVGTTTAVLPWIIKSYGFSSGSSFTMLTVAKDGAAVLGSYVTLKVVEVPGNTGDVGGVVRVKSLSVPNVRRASASIVGSMTITGLIEIAPSVRLDDPEFVIVNVCVTMPDNGSTVPKSVSSATAGVVSPSAIDKPRPVTSISGNDGVGVGVGASACVYGKAAEQAELLPAPSMELAYIFVVAFVGTMTGMAKLPPVANAPLSIPVVQSLLV